ncbi:MAG: 6-bladed beta-propeller [Bacteroidota bacterium]
MKKLIAFLLVLVLTSCDKQSNPGFDLSESRKVHLLDSKIQNDLDYQIVDLIPIQTGSSFDGFSGRLRLKTIDDLFYIFDLDFQVLYCLDSLGNLLYSIGGLGRGPNELSNVIDFTILDSEVSFLVEAGGSAFLHKYDSLGNQIFTSRIQYPISSFEQINSNEYLLYTGWNNEHVPFRLLRWNSQNDNDSAFFYHKYTEMKIGLEAYSLGRKEDKFIFFDPLTPHMYQINSDLSISPLLTFGLGDYELDDDYWNRKRDDALDFLFKNGFYACKYFIWTQDQLMMLGNFAGRNSAEQEYTLTIYSMNENEAKTRVLQQGTLDEVFLNIFTLKNGQLISLGDGNAMKYLDLPKEMDQFVFTDESYYLVYSEVLD